MATLFKRPEPKPGQAVYNIDLPGGADLFKFIIPALGDKELKMARIKRMLTHKSTVPEPLQWIPGVINKIDDAQDLLTTALWLGKPLIRKLPARFIPFVGWAITLSDAANLINSTLAFTMTPGLSKPDVYKMFKDTKMNKKDIKARLTQLFGRDGLKAKFGKEAMAAKTFNLLKPSGWRRKFGDILQAAQASETVTGIGLTLGGVMGAASDLIWSPYRLARGDRVEIRLPPKGDPLTKAYRFLTQTPQNFHHKDTLSPEDHALMLAAHSMAVGIVQGSGIPDNDERIDLLLQSRFPVHIPWEESSREALKESGFDLSRENYYKPYIPKKNPTFADAIDLSFQSIGASFPPDWIPEDPVPYGVSVYPGTTFPPTWRPGYPLPPNVKILEPGFSIAQRREIGSGDEGSIFWKVAKEAAEDSFSKSCGLEEDEIWTFSPRQVSALKLAEYDFKFGQRQTIARQTEWFNMVMSHATEYRRKYAHEEDFRFASDRLRMFLVPKY